MLILTSGEKALLSNLRSKLGGLKHLGKQLPVKCRKMLATGLIMSSVTYMIQVWGEATQNYLRQVQSVLNCTARYVTGAGRRTPTRKLMEDMDWLEINDLIKYFSLISMWTLTRKQIPKQLFDKILIKPDWTLETTPGRLLSTRRSWRWRTTNQWNMLSLEIRSENKLAKFKKMTKQWIKESRLSTLPTQTPQTTLQTPPVTSTPSPHTHSTPQIQTLTIVPPTTPTLHTPPITIHTTPHTPPPQHTPHTPPPPTTMDTSTYSLHLTGTHTPQTPTTTQNHTIITPSPPTLTTTPPPPPLPPNPTNLQSSPASTYTQQTWRRLPYTRFM